jgi:hypothetical protein
MEVWIPRAEKDILASLLKRSDWPQWRLGLQELERLGAVLAPSRALPHDYQYAVSPTVTARGGALGLASRLLVKATMPLRSLETGERRTLDLREFTCVGNGRPVMAAAEPQSLLSMQDRRMESTMSETGWTPRMP